MNLEPIRKLGFEGAPREFRENLVGGERIPQWVEANI